MNYGTADGDSSERRLPAIRTSEQMNADEIVPLSDENRYNTQQPTPNN